MSYEHGLPDGIGRDVDLDDMLKLVVNKWDGPESPPADVVESLGQCLLERRISDSAVRAMGWRISFSVSHDRRGPEFEQLSGAVWRNRFASPKDYLTLTATFTGVSEQTRGMAELEWDLYYGDSFKAMWAVWRSWMNGCQSLQGHVTEYKETEKRKEAEKAEKAEEVK